MAQFLQIHLSLKVTLHVFYSLNLKLCISTDFILLVFVYYAFTPNITWADCLLDRFYNFLNCSCFPPHTLWFWNSQGTKKTLQTLLYELSHFKKRQILSSHQKTGNVVQMVKGRHSSIRKILLSLLSSISWNSCIQFKLLKCVCNFVQL